jgi:hypothetical protein
MDVVKQIGAFDDYAHMPKTVKRGFCWNCFS